jgi:hypothetical protein
MNYIIVACARPWVHTHTKPIATTPTNSTQNSLIKQLFMVCGPIFCYNSHTLFFTIFFVALGFELGALHLPGRCSTAWATPPALSHTLIDIRYSCSGFWEGAPQNSMISFLVWGMKQKLGSNYKSFNNVIMKNEIYMRKKTPNFSSW